MTRSVLGSETMALADGFDAAYAIRHDVEKMTGKRIPLSVYTDSLSLFDVITKATLTAERRLMIDVAKIRPCGALDEVLQTGCLSHPVAQWIKRKDVAPTDLGAKSTTGPIPGDRRSD